MTEDAPKYSACDAERRGDTIPPELSSAVIAFGRKLSAAIAKVNQAQRELGEVKALHDSLIKKLTIE